MKKGSEIILFFFAALLLLTSGITGKGSGHSFPGQSQNKAKQDTSGYLNMLTVDSFHLAIVPPSSGIQFYKDEVIFLANAKNEEKMIPTHISFGAIQAYRAIVKDTSLGIHKIFSPTTLFTFPCEAITFGADYKTIYYTKVPKKENKSKIYKAEFRSTANNGPDWVYDTEPLDFCRGNSAFTHPAISADGQFMIFASDKSGTNGGMDLFIIRKKEGNWSVPENMGKSINTIGNELFPFLDSENNLFFSSDGLQGYGGFDIFTCKFNGETWEKPLNLSDKINSYNDDIAFTINKTDGKSAFYTKRQVSGNNEMQLFKVCLKKDAVGNKPLTISSLFNGKAVPKTLLAEAVTEAQPKKLTENTATVSSQEKKAPEIPSGKKAPIVSDEKVPVTPAKVVSTKPANPVPEELKDVVVYKVQFLSSSKRRIEKQIIINGKTFDTFEYVYLGAYRYTVGEFTALTPARQLRDICKKNGYPDAFVIAVKNGVRSLDANLFR